MLLTNEQSYPYSEVALAKKLSSEKSKEGLRNFLIVSNMDKKYNDTNPLTMHKSLMTSLFQGYNSTYNLDE